VTDASQKIQRLIDKDEIEQVLKLYCRAIDRLDLDLLKTIYHPDAIDDHGSFNGNAHEFADFIIKNLKEVLIDGMHTVTHSVIEIDGLFATSESYYIAVQRCFGGMEKVAAFFGERYAKTQQESSAIDKPQDYFCGGRYLDVFEKRDGKWKIRHRKITNEWSVIQPSSQILDEGYVAHFDLPGSRDRHDPVYHLKALAESLNLKK